MGYPLQVKPRYYNMLEYQEYQKPASDNDLSTFVGMD